ncbi:hypothetical protein BCY84_21668 [Trypanosoma cruzi cruzi]|nr:hypothetical protein BCY84_21668 [Trypanosoma cruzi cruzi]
MPVGGSAQSFTSDMEWLQPRTEKGEVALSDTAAHSLCVLRPLKLSELQRGSRHAVYSAGKQTAGFLSGADGRGRHQLLSQETTTADVAARQGRIPAMFRGPAKGCAMYSPLGDAVVCSAWGKNCFAAGTWEEANFFTPRLPEKKSSLTTKHLPWGKFTIRRTRHPSPKERAALAQPLAYAAPDTTCVVTVADTAASPDSTISPASPASPDSSSGVLLPQLGLRGFSKRAKLRSCQAVFERTSKVLLREKEYRERILEIVEEVCDALRTAAAVNVADTDEGDGVQMMGDFPAGSTVSLPTGGACGPPTVVTEEAPSKSRSISRLYKMGQSCKQFLSVDSASAMPPLSLQKEPVSTSQEQQKFSGTSGERIPNAATQETVLPRLR